MAEPLLLPVPVTTLYPGETIGEAVLERRAFRPGFRGLDAVAGTSEQLVGKVARRTLLPNRPVPLAAVAEPELVRRGRPVELVYHEGGMIIRAQAMSLEGGATGQAVRVRNLDSGLTVTGIIAADGTVRMGGG